MKKRDYPERICDLQEELLQHAQDGRSDKLFRVAIALDQFGSFTRHISHDKELNPTSRPHGTPDSLVNDAGHFLLQSMTLVALSGVDIQDAINSALANLREKDFIARKAENGDTIKGQVACTAKGSLQAKVWVCEKNMVWPSGTWEERILVAQHPEADARITQFAGIITDHGGQMCHAAIIAREHGIPCIVGTGNATTLLQTGDVVEMNTYTGTITKVTGE